MRPFQVFRSAIRHSLTTTSLRTLPLRQNLSSRFPQRTLLPQRLHSTKLPPNPHKPTAHLNSPPESLSLSQRFRKLSREYGWSAVGVYLLLSALDFPFCFAAVRYLGTDRIGHYEHVILEHVKGVIPEAVKEKWRDLKGKAKQEAGGEVVGIAEVPSDEVSDVIGYDHGLKEAEEMNRSENASIWTQLALAYAIHKSFIFIRVPLTAAVTPKMVKTLRGWGWNIGKRRPKGPKGPKEVR